MHPAGIKFGLASGVLQLHGADVIVSDQLLESISGEARKQIEEGERVTGTDIWDSVVTEGLGNILDRIEAPRKEYVPFFTGLDRVVAESLMLFAQKIGVGRKIGRDFLIERLFWDDFGERIRRLELGDDMTAVRCMFFQECRGVMAALYAASDPDNARHADVVALYVFNNLNDAGALQILERLRTAKPRFHIN